LSNLWNAKTYDSERRCLIYCFDEFYGEAAELIVRNCPGAPRILDLGAGTGILSSEILERCSGVDLSLLDESTEMLRKAERRFERIRPSIFVQSLNDPLPSGPFHAVVSSLAIHHLSDDEKKNLYSRIIEVLLPGGIFVNAEQIVGRTGRLQALNEAIHLERAAELGSSRDEIQRALERMSHDRCATLDDQLAWLGDVGYQDADCFYRSFRFAVFAGWRPKTAAQFSE
jgi:tRNA (cmo5U34)-methyltransferase